MKLLQLNIWGGKLLREVLQLIETEQPDILCLQEVFSSGAARIQVPDDSFSCFEVIQAATGYEHSFFSPALTFQYGTMPVSHGNAIISKYPILEAETVFVSGTYDANVDVTQAFPNTRNLQIVQLDVDSQPLVVANHHGYWLIDPMGNQTTLDCMQTVATKLKTISSPLIFAGDLNIIPASPAMRVFDGFLEDLTATHHIKTTLSELGKVPNVPCDHILTSPEITIHDFHASDTLVSDHKALILDFGL